MESITDYENRISEFYFLLDRNNLITLESRLSNLIKTLKYDLNNGSNVLPYLRILYGLIGHCRDIYCGKGERDLSYMMIMTWYYFFPVLAIYAFETFILPMEPIVGQSNFPYGCWNDIKYFSKYILRTCKTHPFLDVIVSYANRQLKQDIDCTDGLISNVAKWIPREKIGGIYDKFVCNWFRNETCHTKKYMSFLKKQYRQIVSQQYNAVAKHSTNNTIFKEIIKGSNKIDRHTIPDIGRHYFHENLFIGDYVKCAISIAKQYADCKQENMEEDIHAVWLNRKWSWIVATFYKCYGGIPIVDISRDISDENLHHAIGFACLIAIKSGIMRIMLVSNIPIWIDISETTDFCSMVSQIWMYCENRGSRFQLTIDLIFQSVNASKLGVLDNIKLFIFSDTFKFDWHTVIKQFDCMNLIFWNLGGEPFLPDFYAEDYRQLILMSGANVALLNAFCNTEILPLNGPYFFLSQLIDEQRYGPLFAYIDNYSFVTSSSVSPFSNTTVIHAE